MDNPFRLTGLEFNGGESVSTDEADIIVLVGPNNVGKSRTLQEILHFLGINPGQPPDPRSFFALSNVEIRKNMDYAGLEAWLREFRYVWTEVNESYSRVRTAQVGEVNMQIPEQQWGREGSSIGHIASHLVRGLWCGERLGYLGQPGRIGPSDHPEHAIHWLVRKPELLEKFKEAFREAFGQNVVLDAWGSTIILRLSPTESQQDFVTSTADGMPDQELMDRLQRLSQIESQSDGVRSFAGIVLTLLASQFPLVLLDEPEAFLHPPQARLLGRSLASLQGDGQLVVATHSLDVLLGLVQARPNRVQIVRLTRENGRTRPRVLSSEELAGLWSNPLLRFSRALDGLFHDGVVVCEGDTDTQFYSTLAETLAVPGARDVMFSYVGGKQRIGLVASALSALGVPVRTVVDFDALRDPNLLRALVESMNGSWTDEMSRDQRVLDAQLRGHERKLSVETAKALVEEALGSDQEREITNSDRSRVRDALVPAAGWAAAKSGGLQAVPPGEGTVSASRLIDELRQRGVWVVPVGEVEGFVRAVGGHGPKWVAEVVEGEHIAAAVEAREFVEALLGSFAQGES